MCGFVGEIRFDGRGVTREGLWSMMNRIERRGPDGEGIYIDGPVGVGHRRLAVIDPTPESAQPMHDEALRLSLVFNGAIYNYHDLRHQLQAAGYQFRSHGDTEVILKAYAHWGDQCANHLQGMFAFAIWDDRRKRLFMARDRLGIKPFYYAHDGKHFLFASNPQALIANGVSVDLDPVALHHHLMLHAVVPAPRTILRKVRKLRPGYTLSIDLNGRLEEKQYWYLSAHAPECPLTATEWLERVHSALRQSVKRRLEIADVPVGVLLSGGLDSGLLVALLAELGVEDLRTFTIGFEDQPEEKGSEFEYSDLIVNRYSTNHHQFLIPNSDVLNRLPEAVSLMSEPMVAQDAVAFYLLSEQVSKHIKVVQSGQGADEVFGGYFWYPQMLAEQGEAINRFSPHYLDRTQTEYENTLSPCYLTKDVTAAFLGDFFDRCEADRFLDAVFCLDITTLIVDDPVKRVDNMTMAWGLEARVPFLDAELVELAMTIPYEMKLSEGGKGILKKIARGLVPDPIIDRPKGYFPLPALKYVRGKSYDFMKDILMSQACRERGLFNRSYVEKLLKNPEADNAFTPIRGNKLWHLAVLELWFQQTID